jgi:hypothetical protein
MPHRNIQCCRRERQAAKGTDKMSKRFYPAYSGKRKADQR